MLGEKQHTLGVVFLGEPPNPQNGFGFPVGSHSNSPKAGSPISSAQRIQPKPLGTLSKSAWGLLLTLYKWVRDPFILGTDQPCFQGQKETPGPPFWVSSL